MRRIVTWTAAAGLVLSAGIAAWQTAPIPSVDVRYSLDSGPVANPALAGGAALVWAGEVRSPHAPWIRLRFDDAHLAGAGPTGSYLLITSMQDGAQQRLDAAALRDWGNTSAYFNGDAVLIELYAFPGTGENRLRVPALPAGVAGVGPGPETICGPVDDRIQSNLAANARLMPIGCTAWIIDLGNCANRFLTAGHCISTTTTNAVVQFNVPLSTSSGTPVNPAPQDQYPVPAGAIQSNGGQGIGLDGAQFFTAPNSTTNLHARFAQQAAYTLAAAAPAAASGQTLRVTGYGTTSGTGLSLTLSQVQKTHTGPFVSRSATSLQYAVDTTGGNSGSPVVLESDGKAIGIHTHAGCTSTGGANNGTAIEYPVLQGYLANPVAGCFPFIPPTLTLNHTPGTLIAPGVPSALDVEIIPGTQQIEPGTPKLHYRSAAGPFSTQPLAHLGGNNFRGTLPGQSCTDEPEYYFSAQGTGGALVTLPSDAPTGLFSLNVGVLTQATSNLASFEGGLPAGWTATGLWNITSTLCGNGVPCDGTSIAYYGQTSSCTFATGTTPNSGSLTSPLILVPTVPAGGSVFLDYCSSLVTENLASWDIAEVDVNNTLVDVAAESSIWETRSANLTAFAGQSVSLRFFFNTVDGQFNSFRGWQVDHLRLRTSSIDCDSCYPDCNADGRLTVGDFGCFQTRFVQGDPYADCNADGAHTVADFGCFQTRFVQGCP